jgi:hypothetical protein
MPMSISNRKVYFGRIAVNEHAYELGDNPSVSDGAPVTIAWTSHNSMVFDLAYYEMCRPSNRRKTQAELRLSMTERADL